MQIIGTPEFLSSLDMSYEDREEYCPYDDEAMLQITFDTGKMLKLIDQLSAAAALSTAATKEFTKNQFTKVTAMSVSDDIIFEINQIYDDDDDYMAPLNAWREVQKPEPNKFYVTLRSEYSTAAVSVCGRTDGKAPNYMEVSCGSVCREGTERDFSFDIPIALIRKIHESDSNSNTD